MFLRIRVAADWTRTIRRHVPLVTHISIRDRLTWKPPHSTRTPARLDLIVSLQAVRLGPWKRACREAGRSKSSTRGLSPPIRHGPNSAFLFIFSKTQGRKQSRLPFFKFKINKYFLNVYIERESFEFGIYSVQLNSGLTQLNSLVLKM